MFLISDGGDLQHVILVRSQAEGSIGPGEGDFSGFLGFDGYTRQGHTVSVKDFSGDHALSHDGQGGTHKKSCQKERLSHKAVVW